MSLADGEADAMIDVLGTHVLEEVWNHDDITPVEGIDILRALITRFNADITTMLADLNDQEENTLCRHNEPFGGAHCAQCERDQAQLERAGM